MLMVSPWILRHLALYVSEFNISAKGISGKTWGTSTSKEIDSKAGGEATVIPPPPPPPAPSSAPSTSAQIASIRTEFDSLDRSAKKVLRTLWRYQVLHFGPSDDRRWGFGVGLRAPDYMEFSIGVLRLLEKHWVNTDSRGLIFLTNEGLRFCLDNDAAVSAFPDYYSNFSGV
jgi:hypothetical protein